MPLTKSPLPDDPLLTALTKSQRDKEGAAQRAVLLDLGTVLLSSTAAVYSGSLTVVAELMRQILMWMIDVLAWVTLRRANRGKLWAFEFGIGKIERVITILIVAGILASAFYTVNAAVDRIGRPEVLPTPALFLAVFAAATNLLQNFYCTADFARASAGERSLIIETQIRSRLLKTFASAIVVTVLVMAMWLPDPMALAYLDAAGALFVSAYMAIMGVKMIRESVPDLLDRSLPEADQIALMGAVARYFENFEHFGSLRSRTSGGLSFVEIELGFPDDIPMAEVDRRCSAIEREATDRLPGAVVAVMPRTRA